MQEESKSNQCDENKGFIIKVPSQVCAHDGYANEYCSAPVFSKFSLSINLYLNFFGLLYYLVFLVGSPLCSPEGLFLTFSIQFLSVAVPSSFPTLHSEPSRKTNHNFL